MGYRPVRKALAMPSLDPRSWCAWRSSSRSPIVPPVMQDQRDYLSPFRAPRLGRRPAVLCGLGLSAILSAGRSAATEAAPRVLRAAPAEVPLLGEGYPKTAV